jgi:excisionase family DNA binding protein
LVSKIGKSPGIGRPNIAGTLKKTTPTVEPSPGREEASTYMAFAVSKSMATLEELTNHLGRLDHGAALALVERVQADGTSVAALVTGLLAPALVEVGRRWASGEVGAAEALAAAAIVRGAIPRTPMPPGLPSHPTVAVCCPPGEHHEIPAEMITELLRAEGCSAQHIGAGVTPKHLPGFLSRQRPAALLVSCTTPCGLPGAARSIEVAHAYGVPVIVGGAAFGRDDMLALRLGAAAWASSAGDVVRMVDTWLTRAAPLPPGRALTEEYLMFEAGLPEIRARAVESLRRAATVADSGDDGPGGLAATQERLELLLRHLGAALLVDDGRLFLDFLSWRAEYYENRDIGMDRLANTLVSVGAALPNEFGRARRFLDEGRQHVSWIVRASGTGWTASLQPGKVAPVPVAEELGIARRTMPSPLSSAGVSAQSGTPGSTAASSPSLPRTGQLGPSGPSGPDQPGRVFADLLFVAATTCHTPYAFISVAQPNGRWSTLTHGIERRDLITDDRLLAAIASSAEPVEISDLPSHPELGLGPLARGPLGVRFVYGMPLRTRQSTLLGVLCIADRRPRELQPRERQALSAIARQVAGQLAMWRRGSPAASSAPPMTISPAPVPAPYSPEQPFRPDMGRLPELVPERPVLHLHRDGGDELLRSHEVAVLFDVTDRTVINWAAAGKLPSIRTAGGHLRFRGEDVMALLTGRPSADRAASSGTA